MQSDDAEDVSGTTSAIALAEATSVVPTEAHAQFAWMPWERIKYEEQLIENESDRGCLLVGLMVLESALKGILDRAFDGLSSQRIEDLFRSLSSKCTAAFDAGFITQREHQDVTELRRMRNDGAHALGSVDDPDCSTFKDPEIVKRCARLSKAEAGHTPRQAFITTVSALSGRFEGLAVGWDRAVQDGFDKGDRVHFLIKAALERSGAKSPGR